MKIGRKLRARKCVVEHMMALYSKFADADLLTRTKILSAGK